MKKARQILLLAVAFVAVFGFTKTDRYPEGISKETVKIFKSQYIRTVTNNHLNKSLEANFHTLFDRVVSVDLQRSPQAGFYYLVVGEKDHAPTLSLIGVGEEDATNERSPTVDPSHKTKDGMVEYCWTPINPQMGCPANCSYPGASFCPVMACAVWNGNECIPF